MRSVSPQYVSRHTAALSSAYCHTRHGCSMSATRTWSSVRVRRRSLGPQRILCPSRSRWSPPRSVGCSSGGDEFGQVHRPTVPVPDEMTTVAPDSSHWCTDLVFPPNSAVRNADALAYSLAREGRPPSSEGSESVRLRQTKKPPPHQAPGAGFPWSLTSQLTHSVAM